MRHNSPVICKILFIVILFANTNIGKSQQVVYQFDEGLSLPLYGQYGREAVFKDELLWQIAEGKMEHPKDGLVAFKKSDGAEVSWIKIKANSEGSFRHRNLRGGYLFFEYDSRKTEVLILEASGYNEVYVNGEPRGGDVYSYGWIQHPVLMKKGVNTILFRGARGQISASLSQPSGDIFLSERDALIPDWSEDWTKDTPGAIRIINTTDKTLIDYKLTSIINGSENRTGTIPRVPPFSSRKVPFIMNGKDYGAGDSIRMSFHLLDSRNRIVEMNNDPVFELRVKAKLDRRKETFFSDIDGSVQYYSVVPSSDEKTGQKALYFTLHGASVEAVNQAAAYAPKEKGIIIAPTNRRPYGFDWEDWGRMDAQEVLGIVGAKYPIDPKQMYLTGHSMGGHGTWQFGVTYPGYWAAIAPSAGWYSFWSYAGKEKANAADPLEEAFLRASNPSNTLALSKNYLHYGIYILHGDADNNVPVSQARFMRKHLAGYHPDFTYYERPGAGHWWGNECVDWPPLFEFFNSHHQKELKELSSFSFSTSCPGISSESRFVTIWQQERDLEISSIVITQNLSDSELTVDCENVQVFKLDLGHLNKGQSYNIVCESDSFKLNPAHTQELFLKRDQTGWAIISQPAHVQKGPDRYGLFKEAFKNRMIFVYGTNGTKEENEWAFRKARFDAETFWYRGNGSVDVISDKEFMEQDFAGRNIIIYGHSEMNIAWSSLLAESPIRVNRGEVIMGSDVFEGNNLAAYFIYPRQGEHNTSIGVVAGSGMEGMISAFPNRYFVSGSGFPDYMLFSSDMLKKGIGGVLATGFFNTEWRLGK